MLRVLFFGGMGRFSAQHLAALAPAHRVVGVFVASAHDGARAQIGRWMRSVGLRSDPCGDVARHHGIPRWFAPRNPTSLQARVATLRPDVICVAGYPRLLPAAVCEIPALGAFNSHAALLPRHRGILPLFWIYYRNDAQTGVTIHRLSERADAGDILAQDAHALERGFPVETLNISNTERGSRLLLEVLNAAREGRLQPQPQDDALATTAPFVHKGSAMTDFRWDVERVWHLLAGLYPWFQEPLRDDAGAPVRYSAVLGYERKDHRERPGSVRRTAGGTTLYCEGGVVRLGH